jgi:hypothetical protein
MNEEVLLAQLSELLSDLREEDDKYNLPVFRKVISNNVPVWTAVVTTPSIAFYIAKSEYSHNRYNTTVRCEVMLYIYNRHKHSGLSLDDILSPLITKVRLAFSQLTTDNENIIDANIVESNKDGGTILPYTLAELVGIVEFVEIPTCN